MSRIAELFGLRPTLNDEKFVRVVRDSHCPFTETRCDVTANRSDRAYLDPGHPGVSPEEGDLLAKKHGDAQLPFGICSIGTQRQNESMERPWIVCPKRLLDLKQSHPGVPPEVRQLAPFPEGTLVRCWWEVKFRFRDPESQSFFEYTFDYLLMPIELDSDGNAKPSGPPLILEIMTSSTRGGGLTEHMLDVVLGREQRKLGKIVKSPYTPNYRQVFARMLAQLLAKSEIAEAWGGRTLWLLQDVLVEYIEQTTDFVSADFRDQQAGNTFMLVYRMHEEGSCFNLRHLETLRGPSRPGREQQSYFTSMLGLGYAPPLEALHGCLGFERNRIAHNWRDFTW